jgi:hypothetical protein
LAEKTVELSKEKQRTDDLLYQMMPKTIADQLKSKSEILIAEAFQSVTIYFSDIAGFYQVKKKSSKT